MKCDNCPHILNRDDAQYISVFVKGKLEKIIAVCAECYKIMTEGAEDDS